MKILSRYTGINTVRAILTVLLVIVAIDTLGALVDGIGDLRNQYVFSELLLYLALTLPERLYEHIPLASLIGCIIGLGAMAGNSELVILRATGISLVRIVGFVLKPVIALIIAGVLIGELIVPYTTQLAENRRTLMRSDMGEQLVDTGLWTKEGNEFIHFTAIYPNGTLYGVSRYHFDAEQRLQQVSFSQKVSFQGNYWLEEDGRVTSFLKNRVDISTFDRRRWESSLNPELLTLVALPPNLLGIESLYHYAAYLDSQNNDSSRHRLSFWSKVLQPVTIASLVLVAISFVFGPLRQVTMGFRVFVGVLVGVVFNTVQDILGPASLVYGFSPLVAVLLPAAVLALIGLLLLKKAG